MTLSTAAYRKTLLGAGFSPIPLDGKRPVLENWPNLTPTDSDIDQWDWGHNTGFLTRLAPTLDVDILDAEAADAVESLVKDRYGDCGKILVRFGRPPKRAIPFRTDQPFPKIAVSLIAPNGHEERLELLADGQQCVTDGIHPDTHQPYRWAGGSPGIVKHEELPAIDAREAQALVDDAVDVLIAEHGYRRKAEPSPGPNGAGVPQAETGGAWGFLDDPIDHDSLTVGAMTLMRTGMHDAAVVNFLRALVTNLHDVDEDRRNRRFEEIPAMVASARAKLGAAPREVEAPEVKDAGLDHGVIPPRQWLLGNTFCRTFLSELTGAGGSGKTAVRLLQYLAAALGRGDLVGEHVFMRACVLIICLEDDENEVRRHIRAACLHHNIDQADLKGWLFYWTPRGAKLVETDQRGGVVNGKLGDMLAAVIDRLKIDLVGIDPFVKAHGVSENDNSAIDQVANLFLTICAERNCAPDLVHHHRKGANQPGDADSGRGGSSLKDAGRLVCTLTPMSQDEAKLYDIGERERRSLVRLDSAKVNITAPADRTRWFRLVGVPIGNGTKDYPSGDEVQTVELWTPPSVWRQLTSPAINLILDRIDEGVPGEPQGRRYTHYPSENRAASTVVQEFCAELTEEQCRQVVRTWLKSGVLKSEKYEDPEQRKPRQGLWVGHRPGDTWES